MFSRQTAIACAAAAALGFVAANQAGAAYLQGFETDTSDWNASNTITRVPSGTNGIPSSSGSYHANITNLQDGYDTGYGDAGYTFFGGSSGTYVGTFSQSVDIYVDTSWAPPANPSVPAFWLDMSAVGTDNNSNFATEHNFHINVPTLGTVTVDADGITPIATLNTTGWYTFEMTFRKGLLPTDPIETDLTIYNSSHTSLGSVTRLANEVNGGEQDSSALGSGGYAWLTIWQNGFAGDLLSIDNATSNAVVPEPSYLGLAGMAASALLLRRRRRPSTR